VLPRDLAEGVGVDKDDLPIRMHQAHEPCGITLRHAPLQPRPDLLPSLWGELEGASGDFRRAAFESMVIDQGVGQEHDVGVHAILRRQVHHCRGMRLREATEEAHIHAFALGFEVPHQRRELVVVSNQDESPRLEERGETCRLRDLR
jgi:hypothetical protein